MTEYIVLEYLYHEGEDYQPGSVIELDSNLEITQALLGVGTIALKPEPEKVTEIGKVKPNVPAAS